MEILITRTGCLVKLSDLNCLEKIKKKLTITHVKKLGNKYSSTSIVLFKILDEYLIIPRFVGFKKILDKITKKTNNIKFVNNLNQGNDITVNDQVDLEDHQQLCIDYMISNIYNEKRVRAGVASCIFVMDTGLGKTYVASALIEKIKKKTLIIIPNTSTIDGWREPFRIYLKHLKLGEYHSKKKEDGDVVLMTINSALSQKFVIPGENGKITLKYYEYFKQFGFVIYDEIHNYPTKTNVEIFWKTNFLYGLGMTATHEERLDEMDIVYYKHVGPLVIAKNLPGFGDIVQNVKWDGIVEVNDYHGPPEFTEQHTNKLGWVDTTEMQKQYLQDPYRTKLLINIIKEKYELGLNIFVFALHRKYLEIIFNKLKEIGLPILAPEIEGVSLYIGGISEEDEKLAKQNARIILITYKYGKEGLSIKRMNCIIFAQPMRNKMRQTVGRILRYGGDTSIKRIIVDIRDMKTSLKSQFDTRKKVYEEKGFEIKHTKINWSKISI